MSAITNLPSNKNFLSPLGFKFVLKRTPGVNYFVQSVNVPGMTLGSADVKTPFATLPFPGDKVTYNDLAITFRVDEELRNFKEIYNWVTALAKTESFEQYRSVSSVTPGNVNNAVSDASLVILNSAMNPIAEVTYRNLFPVSLSDLQFDTRSPDLEYIDAIAVFRFQTYNITFLS